MTWLVEQLHRDGTVLSRLSITEPVSDSNQLVNSIRIGRALDNDLVVDDPHCAAYHARLEFGADGMARLLDLGSINGIVVGKRTRTTLCEITTEEPIRLGQTLIRIRSSTWPLAPERSLVQRAVWPLALLGFVLVLGHGGWEIWLKDVQATSPPYLYGLSGLAAGLCLWSAMYALFGRLVSGNERFFSHLAIASAGYLAGTVILNLLDVLAFASSWLWSARITEPVVVVVMAMTIRFHLRLADPRHWRSLRIGLVVVASLAIVIPIAQQWVSHQRLTSVQTLQDLEHPILRLAEPISLLDFNASAALLKERVDKARKNDDEVPDSYDSDGEASQ